MGLDPDKKEFGLWWLWVLMLLIVSSAAFYGLRMAGVIGERVVFENSYQYSEARKVEEATFRAQLAETERLLTSPTLGAQTRSNLEAQAAALRIKLSVARSR